MHKYREDRLTHLYFYLCNKAYETPVISAAKALGITRTNLSRILNGHSGVSADMAFRLAKALNTSPEFWLNLQMQYDLWIASQKQRPEIQVIISQTSQDVALAATV